MTIVIDRVDLTYELVEAIAKLSAENLCVLAEHMLDTSHTSLGKIMVMGDRVDAILKETSDDK